MLAVEFVQQIELAALSLGRDAGRIGQIGDRLVARLQADALVDGRHERGPPVARAVDGAGAVVQDDEGRQVLVLGAEAVSDPAAQRRPAGDRRAGVHLADAAGVVDAVAPAGSEDGDVVGTTRRCAAASRKPTGRSCRAASTSACRPSSGEPTSPMAVTILPNDAGQRLAGQFVELRLVIERSRWLGPPSMNRKMTRLARAGNCGGFGASGEASAPRAFASCPSK